MAEFKYDDSRLMRMFEELEPKRRVQAMRGAFGQAAAVLRKEAVKNLRASGLKSNKHVEKGVRKVVWKKSLGFRVTIGTRRKRVNYSGLSDSERKTKAHQAKDAIVPLWAEGGTGQRRTTKYNRFCGFTWARIGKGRRTGAMPVFRFMDKTKETFGPEVERTLKEKIVGNIEKTALKYGGKIR